MESVELMKKLDSFLLIQLLMCLSVCSFFLTNIHGLQVLLRSLLLLPSHSQTPPTLLQFSYWRFKIRSTLQGRKGKRNL